VILRGGSVEVVELVVTSDLLSLDVDGTCVKATIESIALAGITCVDVMIEVIVDLLLITDSVRVDRAAESVTHSSFLLIADSACVVESIKDADPACANGAVNSVTDASFLLTADSVIIGGAAESITDASFCADGATESVTGTSFLLTADSVSVEGATESVTDVSFLLIADSVSVDGAVESVTDAFFCANGAAEPVTGTSFLLTADSVHADIVVESVMDCSFLVDDKGGFVAVESKGLLSVTDTTGVANVITVLMETGLIWFPLILIGIGLLALMLISVVASAITVTVEGSKLIIRPTETPSAIIAVDLYKYKLSLSL
jgi:hypothetical protein